MKNWKIAITALGAVAAVTALGACTSGGGSGIPRAAVGAPAAAASGAASGVASSAGGAGAATSANSAGTSRSAAGSAQGDLALGTSKIRTVTLSVTVRRGASVAAQADSAEAIVTVAGGEVDADQRSSGRYATATLVLKVPPEQLATVVGRLSRLGKETSRHRTTTDVTARWPT